MKISQSKVIEKITEKLEEEIMPLYVDNYMQTEINIGFIIHEDKEKRVSIEISIKPELTLKK